MKNRLGALAVLVLVVAAACTGSGDSDPSAGPTPTQTNATETALSGGDGANVFAVPDQVIEQAADVLNVDKDAVEVAEPFTFGSSECFLIGAFTSELVGAGASFAVLDSGAVYRQGGDDDAVSAVLEGCFFGADNPITAGEWAELVARLDDAPAQLSVVTAEISYVAEDVGAPWSAPEISSEGENHTLHFVAASIAFGDIYDVTAERMADGTFSSTYELLVAG